MGKFLAVTAIAGCVLTALGALFLAPSDTNLLFLLFPLLLAVGAIATFMERAGRTGMWWGIALLVVAAVDLFAFTNVSAKGGTDLSQIHKLLGSAFMMATGVLVAGTAIHLNWERHEPEWLGWGGAVAVAAAFLMVFFSPGDRLGVAVAANMAILIPCIVLALAAAVAPVLLLRRGDSVVSTRSAATSSTTGSTPAPVASSSTPKRKTPSKK